MYRSLLVTVILFGAANAAMAGPAPAISSFEIIEVSSAKSSAESVPASALITTRDHGGSYIQIKVLQMGYSAQNPIAGMDTYPMTLVSTEYRTNAARQVIGFVYTFKISKGFESGTVSVSSFSINTGRKWTDSIRIK